MPKTCNIQTMNWSMPYEWDPDEPDVVVSYEPYDDERLDIISVMFDGLDILPILDEDLVSRIIDSAAQHEIDNTPSEADLLADEGDRRYHERKEGY